MKSEKDRRLEILRKVEVAENYLLFQQFSEHELGGFENEKTPDWSGEERYEINQLVRRGYLEISVTKGDEPWLNEAGPEPVYKETYVVLTPAGHDFLEEQAKTWWSKQLASLGQNVLTILLAVIIALASAWALKLLGLET